MLVEGGKIITHSFAGDDPLACKDYVHARAGLAGWEPQQPIERRFSGKLGSDFTGNVAEYIYRDESGRPSRKVVRTPEKSFPQYRWTGSEWQLGVKGVPLYPYRLPEMLAAVHTTVFICEGEKDAERLAAEGFIATTNPMGAGKWKPELNKWFEGRDCFILQDNDQAGRDHCSDVARQLAPMAASVRVVALPGLPEKGDVSDWLDADPDNKHRLVDVAKPFPLWAEPLSSPAPSARALVSRRASDICLAHRREPGRLRISLAQLQKCHCDHRTTHTVSLLLVQSIPPC